MHGAEGRRQGCRERASHSQDSEPGQLLAHPGREPPEACAGQGPAGAQRQGAGRTIDSGALGTEHQSAPHPVPWGGGQGLLGG